MTNLEKLRKGNFKSQEEYEITRLKFMIELTERAISPAGLKSEDYLHNQVVRLQEEIKKIEAKMPRVKKVDKKKKRK